MHLQCLRLNSFYNFQNIRKISNFQQLAQILVPLQGNCKTPVKLNGLVYTLTDKHNLNNVKPNNAKPILVSILLIFSNRCRLIQDSLFETQTIIYGVFEI